MRAFVTGSTGFLGIHLLQELSRAGWEVFAFHRPSSDLSALKALGNIHYCAGDVMREETLRQGMPEGVDAVFHAAGSVGFLTAREEPDQYEINVRGTRNVVATALAKRARRFIHTSTVLTYDFSGGRRISERSPVNQTADYAYVHSKYLAECEVEKAVERGLDAVFLHPAAIFGAHDKATWSKMFREIERGLRLPAAPPGAASLCHMRRVAEAHLRAFERGGRGEHYVLGGVDISFMDLARAIAGILDRPAPWFVLPAPLFKFLGRVEYQASTLFGKEPMLTPPMADILCETVLCDSRKAIDALGYAPSPLEAMLMDCYTWMVGEGLLPGRGGSAGSSRPISRLADPA